MGALEEALSCKHCILSVMGAHAGEEAAPIFERKAVDIEQTGITYWLMKSPKARPPQVQKLCAGGVSYAIFVSPATKGGARPTTTQDAATEYSEDRSKWQRLLQGLSPVTGKIDSQAAALVFDVMTTDVTGMLDLWRYSEFLSGSDPVRFILGCSTVCAALTESSSAGRMQSRYRKIVAVARLAEPYCVWLR